MIKIGTRRVMREGHASIKVIIPKDVANDIGIKPGMDMDFYRDEQDRLILIAHQKQEAPCT